MADAQPAAAGRHRWWWLAGLVATVLVVTLAVRWWRGPLVATDTVVRRDFVQTVVASGRVETPHRVDLGVQLTGTVTRVAVAPGSLRKIGGDDDVHGVFVTDFLLLVVEAVVREKLETF